MSLRRIEEKMHAYLVGARTNLHAPSLIIGGVEDHVHILCRQSKNIALKDLVGEIKRKRSAHAELQVCKMELKRSSPTRPALKPTLNHQ